MHSRLRSLTHKTAAVVFSLALVLPILEYIAPSLAFANTVSGRSGTISANGTQLNQGGGIDDLNSVIFRVSLSSDPSFYNNGSSKYDTIIASDWNHSYPNQDNLYDSGAMTFLPNGYNPPEYELGYYDPSTRNINYYRSSQYLNTVVHLLGTQSNETDPALRTWLSGYSFSGIDGTSNFSNIKYTWESHADAVSTATVDELWAYILGISGHNADGSASYSIQSRLDRVISPSGYAGNPDLNTLPDADKESVARGYLALLMETWRIVPEPFKGVWANKIDAYLAYQDQTSTGAPVSLVIDTMTSMVFGSQPTRLLLPSIDYFQYYTGLGSQYTLYNSNSGITRSSTYNIMQEAVQKDITTNPGVTRLSTTFNQGNAFDWGAGALIYPYHRFQTTGNVAEWAADTPSNDIMNSLTLGTTSAGDPIYGFISVNYDLGFAAKKPLPPSVVRKVSLSASPLSLPVGQTSTLRASGEKLQPGDYVEIKQISNTGTGTLVSGGTGSSTDRVSGQVVRVNSYPDYTFTANSSSPVSDQYEAYVYHTGSSTLLASSTPVTVHWTQDPVIRVTLTATPASPQDINKRYTLKAVATDSVPGDELKIRIIDLGGKGTLNGGSNSISSTVGQSVLEVSALSHAALTDRYSAVAYDVTANNKSSAPATVQLVWRNPPAPTGHPTITLSAYPTSLTAGDQSTFSITASDIPVGDHVKLVQLTHTGSGTLSDSSTGDSQATVITYAASTSASTSLSYDPTALSNAAISDSYLAEVVNANGSVVASSGVPLKTPSVTITWFAPSGPSGNAGGGGENIGVNLTATPASPLSITQSYSLNATLTGSVPSGDDYYIAITDDAGDDTLTGGANEVDSPLDTSSVSTSASSPYSLINTYSAVVYDVTTGYVSQPSTITLAWDAPAPTPTTVTLTAFPKNKILPADQQLIGQPAQLSLTSSPSSSTVNQWQNIFSADPSANQTINVQVALTRSTSPTASVPASYSSPQSEVTTSHGYNMSQTEFLNFISGKTPITINDNGVSTDPIATNTTADFTYTAVLTISYSNNGSQQQMVVGNDGSLSDTASFIRPPNPPQYIGYTSNVSAYAELQQGTPDNQTFDAMSGVPSNQQLYLGVGGNEFIVDIELEYMKDVTSVWRTYHSYFSGTDSQFMKVGAGGDIPPDGSIGGQTVDLYNGGTYTKTWSGSVPNDGTSTTVNGSGSVTAVSVAQPDESQYNADLQSAQQYVQQVNSTTQSFTAASDGVTRSQTGWNAHISTNSKTDPQNVTVSNSSWSTKTVVTTDTWSSSITGYDANGNPIYGPLSTSSSQTSSTAGPFTSQPSPSNTTSYSGDSHNGSSVNTVVTVIANPVTATANPSPAGSYTITVTFTVPRDIISGPDSRNVMPGVEDNWEQRVTYDYLRIDRVDIFKISQGQITNVDNLFGANNPTLTATIQQGNPNIFYNIAQMNAGGNDVAAQSSADGRIRYSLEPDMNDSVTWYDGVRSNTSDGMGANDATVAPTSGGMAPKGGGHSNAWGKGDLYTNPTPSTSATADQPQPGLVKTGYSSTADYQDTQTPEWQTFNKQRTELNTATIISDALILQTSSGDQSVIYFDKNSTPVQSQQQFPYVHATVQEMWNDNPNSAANWGKDHINVGSYNGNYQDTAFGPQNNKKYWGFNQQTGQFIDNNPGSSLSQVATAFDQNGDANFSPSTSEYWNAGGSAGSGYFSTGGSFQNGAGVNESFVRPSRPSKLYIYGTQNIVPTIANGAYPTGDASVFYRQILSWATPDPYPNNPGTPLRPDAYDAQPQPDFNNGVGIVVPAQYSDSIPKVNDVVIQTPVSTQNAMVIALPSSLDQRTSVPPGGAADLINQQNILDNQQANKAATPSFVPATTDVVTTATTNQFNQKVTTTTTTQVNTATTSTTTQPVVPGAQGTVVFHYTGGVQSFTAPVAGVYNLQTWGAQGGSWSASVNNGAPGGYSSGQINLTKGQTIYVYVGGYGINHQGYNGGGGAASASGYGGGATDFRTSSDGNWSDYLNTRILVAGGGGGHDVSGGVAGVGGGLAGGAGTSGYDSGAGGTQSNAGINGGFGYGGSGQPYDSVGGGGGYYGGGGSLGDGGGWGDGGGGSGYVGGVTDGQTESGSQFMPSPSAYLTEQPTSGSTAPEITSVQWSNVGYYSTPTLTITGSNFGSFPSSLPYSGDSGYVYTGDTSRGDWAMGISGSSVPTGIQSWSSSQIVLTPQGSYGYNGWVFDSGDLVTVYVQNPQTGQTASVQSQVGDSTEQGNPGDGAAVVSYDIPTQGGGQVSVNVPDYSFESPADGYGGWQYESGGTVPGAPWSFGGGSGIQQNGSPWSDTVAPAPDGVQTAFLQGQGASISQSLSFPATGPYTISFYLAPRPYYGGQPLNLTVDGQLVQTIPTPTQSSFVQFTSNPITLTQGSHVIALTGLGVNGADVTDLVDNVTVTGQIAQNTSSTTNSSSSSSSSSSQVTPISSDGPTSSVSTSSSGNPNGYDGWTWEQLLGANWQQYVTTQTSTSQSSSSTTTGTTPTVVTGTPVITTSTSDGTPVTNADGSVTSTSTVTTTTVTTSQATEYDTTTNLTQTDVKTTTSLNTALVQQNLAQFPSYMPDGSWNPLLLAFGVDAPTPPSPVTTPTVTTNGGLLNLATFVTLDHAFQVYFPNTGDFAQQPTLEGIPQITLTRGLGYVNNMDTTQYTAQKLVKFDFNVIFDGVLYPAESWISLPVDQSYYDFYTVLANSEAAGATVDFEAIPINGQPSNDPVNNNFVAVTNKDRAPDFTSFEGAYKQSWVDVVGRIGNFAVTDTNDFRFSNLFKQPLNPTQWFINGLVKQVDPDQQNQYYGDQGDILGNPLNSTNGSNLDTYGTQPWEQQSPLALPINPLDNPIPALRNSFLKVGYGLYSNIQTIGDYQRGVVRVLPYYYKLDVNTGVITPLDVYEKVGATYQPVNLYRGADNGSLPSNLFPYTISMDWNKSAARMGYTLQEAAITNQVAQTYGDTVIGQGLDPAGNSGPVVTSVGPMITPGGDFTDLGNAQRIVADQTARTFIGSSTTDGQNEDPGNVLPEIQYNYEAQKWYFKIGLPSNSVFVPAGQQPTAENIASVQSGNGVLLLSADIVAIGNLYTLRWNEPGITSFTVSHGGVTQTFNISQSNLPPVIALYDLNNTESVDITSQGSH